MTCGGGGCKVMLTMAHDADSIRSRVREVLLNDWDPHNAARLEAARGAYDAYIPPLLDLLRSGADEDAVVSFLHEREQESMCFPSLGTQRLRPVARKLLALRPSRAEGGFVMIKMIVLLLGLAIGFGVGVYWSVHNPDRAKGLAAEEERRFLEAQKALLEKTKRKLDEILQRGSAALGPGTGTTGTGRAGFVGARPGTAPTTMPDPEVQALREEHERQIQEAEKLLKQVNGK